MNMSDAPAARLYDVPSSAAPQGTPAAWPIYAVPRVAPPAAVAPMQAPREPESMEEQSSDSPRTPSPILGGTDAERVATPGHLTFPQVGLGTMEQEMQLLTSLEDLEEADAPAERAETDNLASEMLERLAAIRRDENAPSPHQAELTTMVETLAQRVQQQQESREKLRHLVRVTRLASLSLLSSLRISYSHMLHAERDINSRLEVELSGSKSQSRMLSDMVSRASLTHDDERRTTPQRASDVPDDERRPPPTPPAAAERNKLLADKRYLRQRVHDAEAQVARLESELEALRPVLLRHSHDEPPIAPSRTPRTPRRHREAVMGDAKSEHLLLAARMLRTLRHAARGHASPGSTLTDNSPTKYKTDALDGPHTPRTREYPTTPKSAVRPRVVTDEQALAPREWAGSAPLSGIDELLHAAQSLRGSETENTSPRVGYRHSEGSTHYESPARASPTRPAWQAPPASAPVFGSPKRRRVSPSAMDIEEHAGHARTPGTDRLSALDVLADQAATHEAPERSPPKTPSEAHHRRTHSSSHPSLDQPSWTPVSQPKTSQSAVKPRGVGGNQSPEKRLPYVRWSAEEDTKLRKAIKEHGQRWEHVARAVGTRSYHQCRQRYLLMRRKEAAANGLASPSKSTGARTPVRTQARPTHSTHPTPFAETREAPPPPPEEEHGSSESSSYDAEGQAHAAPVPVPPQPVFTSPHARRLRGGA
ncbi:uncharacterized protein MJAP1_001771 [Malassezia japonica]|uniref:Uncharacterized protein n=1 Tax=Malassezia japonica TaxID=223818 RepID=A0AAF0F1H5_9BASI|nr:uncharacterized protein MJAP1_001771 [Malassezia japonica]WFD38807.1 hypothetical protein MJAP1_001771 [Malassezia japonica]